MGPLAVIGLDRDLAMRLKSLVDGPVVTYDIPPRCYAVDGVTFVESPTVSERWLKPRGVVYYSYFDDAADVRRALALSSTPTFPNVRSTIVLDDRVLALIQAEGLTKFTAPRGYAAPGLTLSFGDAEYVLKSGSKHCGEGKIRVSGEHTFDIACEIEPFIQGRSERVLLVGDLAWQLHYESVDWRKNVNATVSRVALDPVLVKDARRVTRGLGLDVAGVDYIVTDKGAFFLEVNAYPGLDDVPEAEAAFLGLASEWSSSLL